VSAVVLSNQLASDDLSQTAAIVRCQASASGIRSWRVEA